MSEANTIWIQLYTPNGAKLGVTIGFADGKLTQTLPPVAMIDAMIADAGYLITLPGLEVGEELETITHVIRRTQHNKKDGTQTPCIGMYFENKSLVYGKKAYLNTQGDIATFERLSGLKVSAMPNFPSDIPLRDNPDAASFIIPVKTPFQIRMVDGTYTDKETGEVKPCKDFAGFYDIGTPAATTGNGSQGSTPSNVTTLPSQSNASGNGTADKSEWRKKVMDLTAFLYSDEINETYDEFNHTAAVQERMNDTSNMGIKPETHTPEGAATVFLAYCVTTNLRLTVTEFPQALGGKSLKAFMDGYTDTEKGLQAAWNALSTHAHSKQQKAANQ